MAASLEGGRRRVETLYRINHLAAIVRAEGYSYSEREIETMRRLSHRHLPALFRVQLLHRAAQREDSIGLRARIEIARTLLREGLLKEVAQDRFLVSFGFGSRDFDALFEMGDGGPVREALVQAAQNDAALAEHLGALGWDGVGSPQQAAQAPAVRPRG